MVKKTALLKTTIREINQSKTRFLSILGIIFLGVMVFVGLKATGPDMTQTASNYFEKQRLPDARVVSSLGLVDKDIELVEKASNVKNILPRYTQDIAVSEKNVAIKFVSYDLHEKPPLLDFLVVEGRLPNKSGEVALDELALKMNDYKLGKTITLSDEDNRDHGLKENTFKIVGFVQSPEYIENMTRGNTTVGKGSLDYFAVIPKEDFDLSTYTEILVSFENTKGLNSYSPEYKKQRDRTIKGLEATLGARPKQRVEEIREESRLVLAEAKQKITAGENALVQAEKQLQDSKIELEDQRQQLKTAQMIYEQKISDAETELAANRSVITANEVELIVQRNELEEKKNQLASSAALIAEAKNALPELQRQQTDLLEQQQLINQTFNGYQELASMVAAFQKFSDEDLPEIVAQSAGQLQAIILSLQAPAEVANAVEQLIEQPNKGTIASVMNEINGVLSNLETQQEQIALGLQTLGQTVTSVEATIKQSEDGQAQIEYAENQLAEGQQQIDAGKEQLAIAEQQIEQERIAGQNQLSTAQAQMDEGQKAYDQGVAEFQQKKKETNTKLAEARKQLQAKETALNELKPADYYFLTRNDNPGYTEFEDNADRIASLSTVFPIFFFLIAALVSLTTMTRMVEEKRTEIGTLKALGYKNSEIAFKFLTYAAIASLCGAVLGLIMGYYLFPTIIFDAYGQLYNIPDFVTPWYLSYSLIGILVAVFCTAGAALIVLRIDLFSTAASLLRPKAPKSGQRILLERIRPIWSRLSFIQKVTARNLFRYKQRMLMTVLGIAGCMALIITGFGLRDSISDVVNIQFNKILHYQAVVTLEDSATREEMKEYKESLTEVVGLKKIMPLYTSMLKTSGNTKTEQDVSLYVPERPDELSAFVSFNERQTTKQQPLTDQGAIISEKLAKLFDYQVGNIVRVKDTDNQEYRIKISAIVENYTGHFIYLTPTYYEQLFGKKPIYNINFLLFNEKLSKETETSISEKLMKHAGVLNITFLSVTSDALDDTIASLNIVVWVLIVVSGLLAFIVLYNLTNINISERIRELSTIKVLGFYDKEVTMYVYRENITLAIIGMIIGCFFGKVVHGYVLSTVEVDMLMFSPTIHWLSYFYSALITLFFTLLVMVLMHLKLKKVDMIEALKSNE